MWLYGASIVATGIDSINATCHWATGRGSLSGSVYLRTDPPGLGRASYDPGTAKIIPERFLPGNSDRESS